MESYDSGKVAPPAAPAPAPANPKLKFYFGGLYILAVIFMFVLRLLPAANVENNWQSTFETRAGFFIIIAVVSLFVAILAPVILIFTSHCLQSLMRDIHYTIFKSIGYFSATTASFSLSIVVFVPLDLNPWIAYPVICILLAANVFACYILWKQLCPGLRDEADENLHLHLPGVFFLMLPLFLAWSAFIFAGLHWIRYMVLYLNLTILVAMCFVITYMTLFYKRRTSSRYPKRPSIIILRH